MSLELLEEIYGPYPPENKDQPWKKDKDVFYLSDAKDPMYVRYWPYDVFDCVIRIAPPKRDQKKMFEKEFPVEMARITGRLPGQFRVRTVINRYCPDEWEDSLDPLFIQVSYEGDIRKIDLKDWEWKTEEAIKNLNGMVPSMIMVFFMAIHAKHPPDLKRPDLFPYRMRDFIYF